MIGALFETNIRYEILTQMLEDTLNNVRFSDNVNVIVDLKSIYRKAYRTDVNNIISDQKIAIEDITSHVLNMIGHYRNFLSKYGKYSTFYILYSKDKCKKLINIFPNYKKYYYNKYFDNEGEYKNLNNICRSVTKQLGIVCKYIPHVYFIDTSKYDEFIYTNFMIRNIATKNDINIILSSDPVLYQALNSTTFALDIKGNNSTLLTEKNVLSKIIDIDTDISGNLLNLVLSICGNEEYSFNKIEGYGYKKSFKIIKNLFDSYELIDKTYMNFPESSLIKNPVLKENIDIVKNNYQVIFPIDLQFQNSIELSTAYTQNKPKVTKQMFNELNQRIFLGYPLNLASLLRGEEIQ